MKLRGKDVRNFGDTVVIAEIGANHNGDLGLAKKHIDRAKAAGADYAKFQSWTVDSVLSRVNYEANRFLDDDYQNRKDHSLKSIVAAYALSEAAQIEMRDYCRQVGIGFCSTPFSKREADFLVSECDVDFVKIASMDCNNYPFLDYVARKGKPVIMSTGLANLSEIDTAVATLEATGNRDIAILHCVSVYPTPDEIVHLRNIDMLRDNYPQYPVGFSDHSLGSVIPVAAIARGACIIEKHFTIDRNMEGWDHKVSAEEGELQQICEAARRLPLALGSYRRVSSPADDRSRPAYRRSIVAARDIAEGARIAVEDLDFKRPGDGFPPGDAKWLVGRIARRAIPYDTVVRPEDV